MLSQTRLTDTEIQQARTRFDVIAADVALKRRGREMVGLCVFHSEKTPSFYVVPDKGFWTCFGCGAHGDAISYVMRSRNLGFVEAVHEINGTTPSRPRDAAPPGNADGRREPDRDKQADVQSVLRGCGPVAPGTAAHLYLWSRGLLTVERPSRDAVESLRAHPRLYCHETGESLPALVAPITSSQGVTALQRIWCAPRVEYSGGAGPRDTRAKLQVRKKTLGSMLDGAVRLGEPRQALGLAEGVETAIAAALCNRGMPVWATCGASRLGSVSIPDGVERIRIYGDNGQTGEDLAYRAADIYERDGYTVEVQFPDARFNDFNDQLMAGDLVR